ncbi:MAG: hypothetical protein ACLP7A_01140 [Desulfobaccales bacterium]
MDADEENNADEQAIAIGDTGDSDSYNKHLERGIGLSRQRERNRS